MPYFLSGLLNGHSEVDFSMDVTIKNVIYDLEENKVDFGLVSVLPEHLDLNTLPLIKNKRSLGTPAFKEYSLENKDQITDTNFDWITKD